MIKPKVRAEQYAIDILGIHDDGRRMEPQRDPSRPIIMSWLDMEGHPYAGDTISGGSFFRVFLDDGRHTIHYPASSLEGTSTFFLDYLSPNTSKG